MSGAASATSRYTKVRERLDNDIFNQNWSILPSRPVPISPSLRFGDLFSGAGGMSVGFRRAGFEKCFSVEINPYASATIRRNFPDSHHFEMPIEDLTREHLRSVPGALDVDILCGGPPCQGFSVAGRRVADDPRNKMFLEFCRIVEMVRPDAFVMENVPGILTMQGGAVYRAILDRFAEMGYPGTSVRILEAAEFGVPQLRTRAIFIGNRLGIKNPYPAPTHARHQYRSIDDAIDDLADEPRNPGNNHEWTAHSTSYEARIAQVPPGGSLYETFRDAFKRQHSGLPSMAAKENHGGTHIHHRKDRVLSARELARLQTFPDDFFFEGGMKKAYWQVGNAVPCTLAERIAQALGQAIAAYRVDTLAMRA